MIRSNFSTNLKTNVNISTTQGKGHQTPNNYGSTKESYEGENLIRHSHKFAICNDPQSQNSKQPLGCKSRTYHCAEQLIPFF